jgi:5-methylcytosine-specific restriction endonuclease McrA
MPFGRLHEEAAGEAKLLILSDGAWRMWGMGLIYCQKNLTDGFIDERAIATWGIKAKPWRRITDELCREQVKDRAPLWERVDGGFKVHDYLQWNDSKAQILASRQVSKTRRQLYGDVELLAAIRERDGSACRYCGRDVNWRDRRGPGGATYDHVDPAAGNTLENVVVACRGCNSSKGPRTLQECGMVLGPAPNPVPTYIGPSTGTKSVLEIEHAPASGRGTWYVDQEREKGDPPAHRSGASGRSDGVFAGSLPKDHLRHAACDETLARCVPQAVHDKLANKLAPKHSGDRNAAGAELKAWYPSVWNTLDPDFVMPDAFKFWEGQFDATFASPLPGTLRRVSEPKSTVPSVSRTQEYLRQQRQG